MSKSRLIRFSGLGFLGGVAFASFIKIDVFHAYIAFLSLLTLFIFVYEKPRTRLYVLMFVCATLGIIRLTVQEPYKRTNFIGNFNGNIHTINGKIAAYPDVRENHQKLIMSNIHINGKEKVFGRLLLLTDFSKTYIYGQELTFDCQLQGPYGTSEFAYDKYLARFSVYSICAFPEEITIHQTQKLSMLSMLFSLRNSFKENVQGNLQDPQAGLLLGLLLGERRGMPTELTDIFRTVGLSHIVALSGYNISVLVGIILLFAKHLYIPRHLRFVILTVAIFGFVLGTGASASVTRAGIMGFLILFSYELGRIVNPFHLLLIAAVFMTFVNPKILIWDIGWQLSFLATYALLTLTPLLMKRFHKLPNPFGIRDIIFVTFSAILFTAPLVMFYFGGISLIAFLANVLILPFVPFIMVFGLFSGILGSISYISSFWIWPSWLLLSYVIYVSEFLSRVPLSFISIERFPFFLVPLSYAVILYFMHRMKKNLNVSITT